MICCEFNVFGPCDTEAVALVGMASGPRNYCEHHAVAVLEFNRDVKLLEML